MVAQCAAVMQCAGAAVIRPGLRPRRPDCGLSAVRPTASPIHAECVHDTRTIHRPLAEQPAHRTRRRAGAFRRPVRTARRGQAARSDNYCFERGAGKASGGDGWADVWKRGHFGWENKRPGRDLRAALKQLTDYALELDNPPLLVVSDREIIEIHTAFTGYPDQPRRIAIADIGSRSTCKPCAGCSPIRKSCARSNRCRDHRGSRRPVRRLAETLRKRGLESQPVAHFLIQCLFCMFAEDEGLLPRGIFTGLLAKRRRRPGARREPAYRLFTAMQTAATTATTPSPGSTAACSPPSPCRRWNAPNSPPCNAPPTWTGATSTPRSSAPCSSAA
jgi:hypothetical protein